MNIWVLRKAENILINWATIRFWSSASCSQAKLLDTMNVTRQSNECPRNVQRTSYTKGLLEALQAVWRVLAHFERLATITRHNFVHQSNISRDTTVDIVTSLRAEVREIVVRLPAGTRLFALLQIVHIDSGPIKCLTQGYRGLFPPIGERCPYSDRDHSPSSIFEVNNERSNTSTTHMISWCEQGTTLPQKP
jgi:hypothetical protein